MFDRIPAIRQRLAAPFLLAFTVLGVWVALESAIFRSGAYFRLAEPESNTGAVITALEFLERNHKSDVRNILVFGDSRVAEGFSARHAAAGDAAYNFINLAVPGSSARTWYYLLREIDRRGYDFDAVVVGTLYRSTHGDLLADWPLDIAHAAAFVGLRDVASFPATFASPAVRDRARHAILFPALAAHADMQTMLQAPLARWRKLTQWRPAYLDALGSYAGHDGTMPPVAFDASNHEVADWGQATSQQRLQVQSLLGAATSQTSAVVAGNDAFQARWLERIADLARSRDAQLVIYPLPRGPYASLLDDHSRLPSTLARVARHSNVVALRADQLRVLEDPAFFFDALHANRPARERTGTVVGAGVRAALVRQPAP